MDEQTRSGWRAVSSDERSLVEAWLRHWNARTGDVATLSAAAVARSSCDCGTCPTFAVRPVVLDDSRVHTREPYVGEGDATAESGPGAGLLVWGLMDHLAPDEIEFEIYPFDDERVELDRLRFRFTD